MAPEEGVNDVKLHAPIRTLFIEPFVQLASVLLGLVMPVNYMAHVKYDSDNIKGCLVMSS